MDVKSLTPQGFSASHHRQRISLSARLKTRIDFEKTCGTDRFCGIMKQIKAASLHQHGKGEQMKKLLGFIANILYVGMVIWDIIEFLALPALFVVIGLLNSFPWQYYAISIGGYFALFIGLEIILHFIFKALDKKHTSLIERILEK